jgi:cytoskeletal protein RodZ
VSAATGISPAVLHALENEDREKLPAEVYIKAFYKKFAEYLDLNPEDIHPQYQQQAMGPKKGGTKVDFNTVITLKDREENLFAGILRRLFFPIAVLILGILFYWIYKNYLAPHNTLGFWRQYYPAVSSLLSQNGVDFFS